MKKPTSWKDITVSQFMEIKSINSDDTDDLEMMSILLDLPMAELEQMDIVKFQDMTSELSFIRTSVPNEIKERLNTSIGTLHLIDFMSITIGEFIDLEHYFSEDYIQNLPLILSILYRRKLPNEHPELFEDEFEKYGTYIEHRSNIFLETSIEDVFGIITKYLSFRQNIFTGYEGLFNSPDEEIDEEEIEDIKSNTKSENKWGWNPLIYILANRNPLKFEEATGMGLIQGLNILSMRLELKMD